jgi:hypothetical protein
MTVATLLCGIAIAAGIVASLSGCLRRKAAQVNWAEVTARLFARRLS